MLFFTYQFRKHFKILKDSFIPLGERVHYGTASLEAVWQCLYNTTVNIGAIPILGIHSRQTVSSSKPFLVNFKYPTYGDQSQNQQMF